MDSWIASISMEVFFASRLKDNCNPLLVAINQSDVRALDGYTLNEVVRPIRRKILDAEVECLTKNMCIKTRVRRSRLAFV